MSVPGRVFTKNQLIQAGWGENSLDYVEDNSIMVALSKLRSKIGDEFLIKNIRGLGYRLEEKKEDEKKEESEEKTEEKKKDKKKKDKKKKGEGEKKEEEKKEEEKKEEEKPAAAEEKEEEKKGLSAGWNAVPSLENGWTSVAEEPAEICVKDMLIRMRGCVNGSKGKIFTLPEGFAPAATERFPCVKKGEESKVVPVTVDQDGNVIAGATDGVLCLSTIVFFKK